MPPNDKSNELLLELGNPAVRRNRSELLAQVMRAALLLMDADAVVVRMPSSRNGKRLALHARSLSAATLPAPPRPSEVVQRFAECCQPLMFANLADDPRYEGIDECPGVLAGPAMFIPLRQREPLPGYLAAYRGPGRAPFTPSDCLQMLLLTAWLSTALESLQMASGMERLAVTDDITDIYNSRFLNAALGREIRRAGRYGQELSILRIEIDQLDACREERGELNTGALLRNVAMLLAQRVRAFDLMARDGESSFVLMLPQTNRKGAVELAERVRAAVAETAFAPSEAGSITVSLGVACFPGDADEGKALLAISERTLQRAQERGGNSVDSLVSTLTPVGTAWKLPKLDRKSSSG